MISKHNCMEQAVEEDIDDVRAAAATVDALTSPAITTATPQKHNRKTNPSRLAMNAPS